VGVERAERSVEIAAPAEVCHDAVLQFETYPEWQSAVRRAEVRSRGDAEAVVAFEIDARVRTIGYVLRYRWDTPERVFWALVEGDVKSVEGDYTFVERDGLTTATYRLAVDPGGWARFVPGDLKRRGTEALMRSTVEELKARVEGS
jgi:ribosome-associated toxin RatA of RatAB toxin-antitoxin module